MNSAIVSVGTELLFGQTINTNAAFLSSQLNEQGINVMYHYTVGDNPERLRETLKEASEKCDLIITTGGLGPTQDDLTKEVIASFLNDTLILNDEALNAMEHYFSKAKRVMTENNVKQAYIPSKSVVFQNQAGTAPGFALEDGGKIIVALPGPPSEMMAMWKNDVLPYLSAKSDHVIFSKMLRVFGMGESAVETKLLDLINTQTNPTIATYAKEGNVCVRVTAKAGSSKEAEDLVELTVNKIRNKIGEFIYSEADQELVEVVGTKLLKNKITISSAESCTGGLFSSELTSIPGISAVFDRGIITYSYEAKKEELGVKQETLETFGAVSCEAAIEMAKGLKAVSGSDINIAVTGIAGPGGDSTDKPVGLVYICMIYKEEIVCKEFRVFMRQRNAIRKYTTLLMLDMINKAI